MGAGDYDNQTEDQKPVSASEPDNDEITLQNFPYDPSRGLLPRATVSKDTRDCPLAIIRKTPEQVMDNAQTNKKQRRHKRKNSAPLFTIGLH